jgi:hypothetical protein
VEKGCDLGKEPTDTRILTRRRSKFHKALRLHAASGLRRHIDELDLPEEKRRAVTAEMDIIDGELAIGRPNQP